MRVLYLYTMKSDAPGVRSVASLHAAYWHDLAPRRYEGGPFADRTGGLITFETDSIVEATQWISADPFVTEQLIETSLVKEWQPEPLDRRASRSPVPVGGPPEPTAT